METNKNKISIANILALCGLAGIGVFTFFGGLLHSKDGTPGAAIIGAVVFVVALLFFLIFSIVAKGAKDNPDKWRYVEWACVVIYIVIAICFAKPFQRYFYVTTQKAELQRLANKEVAAIEDMYDSYNSQQKDFLDNAVNQIKNYNASGQSQSSDIELSKYVRERVGKNVDSWASKAERIVKRTKDAELEEIKKDIKAWSIMSLSDIAARLETKDREAWKSMEEHIKDFTENNHLIPVINGGSAWGYSFGGYAEFDLGTSPTPLFAKALRETDGNTVLGWIIYVIINMLVLLNYIVAPRSGIVGPSKGEIGGAEL